MANRKIIRRVSNALLVIIIFALTTILTVKVRPTRRGFFCDDDSIRYPYKDNTVTATMLLLGAIILPHVIMFAIEILAIYSHKSQKSASIDLDPINQLGVSQDTVESGLPNKQNRDPGDLRRACMRALWQTSTVSVLFWFGILITFAITQVGKLSIGRLRPHFYDVCKPTNFTCEDGYVTDYVCSSYNLRAIYQARMSFPSGHASLSVFVALFLVLHIQRRLPVYTLIGFLLKPFLQFLLAVTAFYTSLSRVTDNMHHFSDITVGAIIGGVIAIWMMHCYDKQMHYNKTLKLDGSRSTQLISSET